METEEKGEAYLLQRPAVAVLDAVGQVPGLWETYVVKGGLALRYAYGSPRETHDLDFNAIHDFTPHVTPEKVEHLYAFCDRLDEGPQRVSERYGYAHMCVQYRELSSELPVIFVRVGHTEVPACTPPYDAFVEVQVTLSDLICETRPAELDGVPIHVPALEDILADKLKVLIQQPLRRTFRSSDLFDLWYYTTCAEKPVDRERLARFLQQKSAAWADILPITREKYRDPRVKAHVAVHFDEIRGQLPPSFRLPSVDEAFAAVLALVDALDLPERA